MGTIIRGFRIPTNRGTTGLAPALANSGNTPNLKIQLPNPNRIPGNIVVRSGFDPIQAYQGETMGSGGMQHPEQSIGISLTTASATQERIPHMRTTTGNTSTH